MEAGDKDLGRRGTDSGTAFVYKENQRYRSCVGRGWGCLAVVTDRCCRAPWCSLVPKCGLSGLSRLPLITAQAT